MTAPDCPIYPVGPIRPALLVSLLCHALLLGAVALHRAGLPQAPARTTAGAPTTLEIVLAPPPARLAVATVATAATGRPAVPAAPPAAPDRAMAAVRQPARRAVPPAAVSPARTAASPGAAGGMPSSAGAARPATAGDAGAAPRAEPDSELPSYLAAAAPVYPAWSRDHGEQGRVLVRVTVAADGTVEAVAVVQGSGYPQLDRAALDSVRRWRFRPARHHGIAQRASVNVPVRFSLSED